MDAPRDSLEARGKVCLDLLHGLTQAQTQNHTGFDGGMPNTLGC